MIVLLLLFVALQSNMGVVIMFRVKCFFFEIIFGGKIVKFEGIV